MYTKLFSSITDSSIWSEDSDTRIVWITMLAMADAQGYVAASVPGLAKRSGVSLEKTKEALIKFLNPDQYSRSQDFNGKRIESIDGGWILLNHEKYRAMRSEEERREYMKNYMKEYRTKNVNNSVNNVSKCKPLLAQAEAEAEAYKEKEASNSKEKYLKPEETLKPKLTSSTQSIKRLFTDNWCLEFQKTFGVPYKFEGAKDGLAADSLLSTGISPSDILDIAKKAWSNQSGFWSKKAVSLAQFSSKFNEIRGEVGSLKPVNKASRQDATEYLNRMKSNG